ncbi:ribonuclease M5 [Mycoplasmoides alvi]|uniref:ribonuclease M5 n=1 Tax=Mycoplasmoides alvi TaxID=78580 RepID=UPI0006980C9A|nr:ribonuclease M5 [Mycoplasmoides alvi]
MSNSKQNSNQIKETIKEIIIVEGKTDTQKLQKLFNVKTIETNGSALTKETINLIKRAAETVGVILFFDPDYQGNKIRKLVSQHLNFYKECFIKVEDIKKDSEKKGIAEANDEAIIFALKNYVTNSFKNEEIITWNEYLNLNLNSKEKRIKVCNYLKISYANHKQLFKKLNLLGINFNEIQNFLDKND